MKLWIITSIRMAGGRPLPAPALQNLRTAEALARAGCDVLLWIAQPRGGKDGDGDASAGPTAVFEAAFNRSPPPGLAFLPYVPHGARDDKKTPFARKWDRWRNPRRAAALLGGPPDAIISRSPLALAQLRAAGAGLESWRRIKLVLEWQYPESMQLWRGWRKRFPRATMAECKARLREWHWRELADLHAADGILYAARDHERLLAGAGYDGQAAPLPSACEAPEEIAGAQGIAPDFDFGFAGALAPENGVECLLGALAQTHSGRLLLLGAGADDYVARLKSLAENLKITQRVEFAGAVPPHAVRDWMRRCGAGIVPIERRCGPEKRQFASPLKLIEWMGAGVPVIASDVPSVAQRLRQGPGAQLSHAADVLLSHVRETNALLFHAGDADALARVMTVLHGNSALRGLLAAAGLIHAREHSFAHRAARIVDFIESLRKN